jgi:outer membrane protein
MGGAGGGRRRAAWVVGVLLSAGAAGPSRASDGPNLAGAGQILVGDVAAIDLQRIRRLTDASNPQVRDSRAAAPDRPLPISLKAAVEVALLHNLDLQIARSERDAARHEVPATRAKFHPTTGFAVETAGSDLGGSSSTQSALAFLRQEVPTGGTVIVNTDFFRSELSGTELRNEGALGLEVRQPLMRGGRPYVARREILDAGYEFGIQDAQFEAEVLRITRDTKVAYYDTILAARLVEVTEAAVERSERLIEASEALFQAARASKRDVVSAQIRLADDLAGLAVRRAELRQAQLALRDVLGLPLAELVHPAESSVPFRVVTFHQGEWVERALRDRPEIRELRTRLEQIGLRVRISGNDVLPKLDMLGTYRRTDDGGKLSRAFDLGSERWTVGLEFEIPFANIAARERLTEAEIDYGRVERELERERRLVEREVRSEVIELRRNLAEVSLQSDKVERSREKLEVAIARYRLGIANNLDITDAQSDLLDAETDLLTAIFDYTNGLARLEASIAGSI